MPQKYQIATDPMHLWSPNCSGTCFWTTLGNLQRTHIGWGKWKGWMPSSHLLSLEAFGLVDFLPATSQSWHLGVSKASTVSIATSYCTK